MNYDFTVDSMIAFRTRVDVFNAKCMLLWT